MLVLAMSLLWWLRLRSDNSLPSDKATTSPLRGSSRPGRSQGLGGPRESSNSRKLQLGWYLLRDSDQPLPSRRSLSWGPAPASPWKG